MKPETIEPAVNLIELLEIHDFSPEQQEQALMEFRIRGIDVVIDNLKKTLDKENKTALNNHLKLCPSIECLVKHLQTEHKGFSDILSQYIPKLHKKLTKS